MAFCPNKDAEKIRYVVTPAKAGDQKALKRLDSRFRRDDLTGREKAFSASCQQALFFRELGHPQLTGKLHMADVHGDMLDQDNDYPADGD